MCCFLLTSCKKEEDTTPELDEIYTGVTTALQDNNDWMADNYAFIDLIEENGINLIVTVLINNILIVEKLVIRRIPFEVGTYPVVKRSTDVDKILISSSFFITSGDEPIADYSILESDSSSFVTLKSYDEATGELDGTFDLTFKIDTPVAGYPDTIRFRDGVFDATIVEL